MSTITTKDGRQIYYNTTGAAGSRSSSVTVADFRGDDLARSNLWA